MADVFPPPFQVHMTFILVYKSEFEGVAFDPNKVKLSLSLGHRL